MFDGLGLKNFEYGIDFIDNQKCEVHASIRISHVYKQAIKNELENMIKQNVVQATPAVSSVVVVKQRGKIGMCIDPRDLNRNVIRS